jgi:UDP-N-acetylmuramoyl-L-alanyl-D-glutamate--2,6-diaminopimelate ligase
MKTLFIIKESVKKILPSFLVSWYHFLLALFAAVIYRFSSYSEKIKVIGVTGTNGKSTVIKMASKILEEAGFKVALSSSIKFKIGNKEQENTLRMTMPGRLRLQRFLRQALDNNCQYVLLEVTSEGIKQYRHKFINFDAAVFTNLTPEHIESHGSFDNYKKAKGKLFQSTKGIHILNLDDENIDYFLRFKAKKKYGYGINSRSKVQSSKLMNDFSIINKIQTIMAKECMVSDKGLAFSINNTEFNLNLLGKFNIYNSLAAISIALSQGIDLEVCKRGLEKIRRIPGRMETVISGDFKVIVDYAFTPNALKKVYQTIKKSFNPKKLICVLGACGGGRDKWKRPVLGKIAQEHCDRIIITNEDPYNEDPMEIINQVAGGAGPKAEKVSERRDAIKKALGSAEKGDLVIITGKGSEPCICEAGGKKIPWDDRKVAREEYEKLKIKLK